MGEGAGDQKPTNPVVKWLGIVTAVVIGAAGLVEAVKKLDDAYELWTPKPKPVPNLPEYVSPKVSGGHTGDEYCAPQRDKYASQYPEFNITYVVLPGADHKDLVGRVIYEFHCQFIAAPKAK